MPREANTVAAIRRALLDRGAFVVKLHGGPHQRAGLPDLVVIYRGRTYWFEVKQPGGRPTPLQAATIDAIRAAGGAAYVVTSVAEALRIVDEAEATA